MPCASQPRTCPQCSADGSARGMSLVKEEVLVVLTPVVFPRHFRPIKVPPPRSQITSPTRLLALLQSNIFNVLAVRRTFFVHEYYSSQPLSCRARTLFNARSLPLLTTYPSAASEPSPTASVSMSGLAAKQDVVRLDALLFLNDGWRARRCR